MSTICNTVLPSLNADFCDPNVFFGRIDELRFTRRGDALTDVASASEWATRIDNTAAIPTSGKAPIRRVFVVGQMPEPATTEIEISLGRKTSTEPKYTVTGRIDDTGDVNWEMARTMSGKTQGYSVWFKNGKHLIGGDDGINAEVSFKGMVIPESAEAVRYIPFSVSFIGLPPAPIEDPLG
jgi:hypothetical protein